MYIYYIHKNKQRISIYVNRDCNKRINQLLKFRLYNCHRYGGMFLKNDNDLRL